MQGLTFWLPPSAQGPAQLEGVSATLATHQYL